MQFIFSQWVRLKAFLKLLITLSAVLMSPALFAHVLCTKVNKGNDVYPINFLNIAFVTFCHAMGKKSWAGF